MGSTQFKLATGNKVKSALDNPSSFFAAQGLNNRAGDLSALLDGMGQSVQALKAADEGIKGLTKLVEQAKAIAQSARSDASGNASITGTHSFTAAEMADLDTVAGMTANDTFTVSVAGAAATTITVAANETMATMLGDLNAITGINAELVSDSANAGQFFLKISTTGGESLDLGNGVGVPATDFGLSLALTNPTPANQTTNEASYATLLTQIDEYIADTGYRGVNLLNGDTQTTTFNEDGSSSLSVSGTLRDSGGLGLGVADFSNTTTIDANLDEIAAALTTLRTDASGYGNNLSVIQTRQDFTTNLINVLKDGATALTIADKNEEGANMLALQTSQQLGIQALSLASQANQSVLRLFQ
jgi:flagellin-like hook-associated protein FlgL